MIDYTENEVSVIFLFLFYFLFFYFLKRFSLSDIWVKTILICFFLSFLGTSSWNWDQRFTAVLTMYICASDKLCSLACWSISFTKKQEKDIHTYIHTYIYMYKINIVSILLSWFYAPGDDAVSVLDFPK